MKNYNIKKLLTKDRGATKAIKGRYSYSNAALEYYESELDQTRSNVKEFNQFKYACQNNIPSPVSSSFYYSYVGVVLENNLVINFKNYNNSTDARTSLFKMGERIKTPGGKLTLTQLPSGLQLYVDKNNPEDLESMTESIYDLNKDDMVDTMLHGRYKFRLRSGVEIQPSIIVQLPNIEVKKEYQPYFKLVATRYRLQDKLEGKIDNSLRAIVQLDEMLPDSYVEERKDWTPEERVYRYVCSHMELIDRYRELYDNTNK